jgi:hypothetical protein
VKKSRIETACARESRSVLRAAEPAEYETALKEQQTGLARRHRLASLPG